MFNQEITEQIERVLNQWNDCFGAEADDFVETLETVDDFKNNAYSWSNSEPSDKGNGLFTLENHQCFKGDTRGDLLIIDLGEKRYVFKF